MGFEGLVITDALDMGALDQGPAQVVDIITMMRGGTDLLLCMPDSELQDRVRTAVERGASRGLIPEAILAASRQRIERLRGSTAGGKLRPELVGSEEHLPLAVDLANKSVTVVRNDDGMLPLKLTPEDRILSLEPQPSNVTPADTTALYPPFLADALRAHHQSVTAIVYPHEPGRSEVDSSVSALGEHDLAIVGTVTAARGQADLVRALLDTGKPVVTVALRTPYDLAQYPKSGTHLCTYSSHQPSMAALARALFLANGGGGVLPVTIPGIHPRGHGLQP
jgi:beta-N-acetylhexosaminidase